MSSSGSPVLVGVIYIPIRLGGYRHVFSGHPASTLTLPPGHLTNYATLAIGSGLFLFLYPHTITGALSASSRFVVQPHEEAPRRRHLTQSRASAAAMTARAQLIYGRHSSTATTSLWRLGRRLRNNRFLNRGGVVERVARGRGVGVSAGRPAARGPGRRGRRRGVRSGYGVVGPWFGPAKRRLGAAGRGGRRDRKLTSRDAGARV
jgi:hypothetical protein